MADLAPVSLDLWIGDRDRAPFLALLTVASYRAFVENPLAGVRFRSPSPDALDVLRRARGFWPDIAFDFAETPADVPTVAAGVLSGAPCGFFSRPTVLASSFRYAAPGGGEELSFGTGDPASASAAPESLVSFAEGLAENGLVIAGKLPRHSQDEVKAIQEAFRKVFDNAAFWNFRYATNLELGSGQGSRGRFAAIKRQLLLDLVLRRDDSVLDVGCGDLEVVRDLPFRDYTGIDLAQAAIDNGRRLRPQWRFHLASDAEAADPADCVLCFDVLIHQPTEADARRLIDFVARKAKRRIIITGYDRPVDSRHIVYFYRPLAELLSELPGWKAPVLVTSYHDMSVYVVDRIGEHEDPMQHLPAFVRRGDRPLVTVTVTSYNLAGQIGRCLESIRRQSERSLIIRVIDDGSADGTPDVIRKVMGGDGRIRIHADGRNLGVSARRNEGLRAAEGDYHLFVDGDDWLAEDAVASLLDIAVQTGSEIVRGSHKFFNLYGKGRYLLNQAEQSHQPEVRGATYDALPSLAMLWTSWNTLMHRRVYSDENQRFDEGLSLGEDRIFMARAFQASRAISLTKKITYFWDCGPKGTASLSMSRDPLRRLKAIPPWLSAIADVPTPGRLHLRMASVSAFHEITDMLMGPEPLPDAARRDCYALLERLEIDPDLLANETIKGWRDDLHETRLMLFESLRGRKPLPDF